MAENSNNRGNSDIDYPTVHPTKKQEEQIQESTPLTLRTNNQAASSSESTITNALFSETRMTHRRLTNFDDLSQADETNTMSQQSSAQHHPQPSPTTVVATSSTTTGGGSTTYMEVMDGAHSSSASATTASAATPPSEEPTNIPTRLAAASTALSSATAGGLIYRTEETQPASIALQPPLPGHVEPKAGRQQESMAVVSANMTNPAITPAPEAGSQHGQPVDNRVVHEVGQINDNSNMGSSKIKLVLVPRAAVSVTASNPVAASTNETRRNAVNDQRSSTSSRSSNGKKKRTPPASQPGQATGRWTHAEHEAFIEGLKIFGREWKKVAVRIPTRTSAQVRSHAQKYFSKLTRDEQLMEPPAPPPSSAAPHHPSSVEMHHPHSAEMQDASTASSQAYSPSLQRNVERILANPEQAQRDVEDTLQALRERYHQLQQRLREHRASNSIANSNNAANNQQEGQGSLPASNVVEEEKEVLRREQMDDESQRQPSQQLLPSQQEHQRGKRRRSHESSDDCSMASSTLSALGNEELIALSVLGATLPNIGSPSHNSSSSHPADPSGEASGHPQNNNPTHQPHSNASPESHSSSSSICSTSSTKRKHDEAA